MIIIMIIIIVIFIIIIMIIVLPLFPFRSFQLVRLSNQLLPHRTLDILALKDGLNSGTSSPFIYTPLGSRNSTLQRDKSKVGKSFSVRPQSHFHIYVRFHKIEWT